MSLQCETAWLAWVGQIWLNMGWALQLTRTMNFFPGKLELRIQYYKHYLGGFLNGGDINLGAIAIIFCYAHWVVACLQ